MSAEKLKIAFLLGSVNNKGGIARVTSLLTESLYKTSLCEVHVIGYSHYEQEGYGWSKELNYHHLLDENRPMKKGIFKATRKLRRLLKKQQIEVLVCCSSLFGPLGVLATRYNATRLIYWDHSSFFESTAHDFAVGGKRLTAFFADAVVPLTQHDQKNYKEHTRAKQVVQIYNPIDAALENRQHDYDTEAKQIISVGRLTYLKNFELLADIAKNVLKKHQDWQWHIYGSGESEASIRTKIIENGIEDRLVLKGHASNIYDVYKDYALMVMTSRSEGFPMTLLEGMANKLPLVSFDIISGPNEIIRENENGFLIEPLNARKMAEKINELIENPEIRKEFSKNNMKYIDQYNLKSITEKWISLFRNVLNKQ